MQGMVQKMALYLPEAQRHPSGGIAQQLQVHQLSYQASLGQQRHASMRWQVMGVSMRADATQ